MGFRFYLASAWKNIRNSKKQSFLYTTGIIISITLILSLQLWASTAEDLAARDFLQDQDYEIKVTSYFYEDMPFILQWLQNDPLVESTSEMYYNIALFNAEDKPITYRWYPEENQENNDDPVSVSALSLFPKNSLSRIESQFVVRGEFDIDVNEVLISEFQAAQLAEIYGYEIEPGMQINVSIARRGPELGEVFLYHCELKYFYNVTVKGIYRTIPSISMLQKTFSSSFLKDSIIFLSENMDELDIAQMKNNGLFPVFMVKCKVEELKNEGINQILQKMEDLINRLKLAYQSSQSLILTAPTKELQQSYSLANTALIFALPVVATSLILSLFTTNIVIENRKKQMETLQDRGGQKWQIIVILLLEFLILSIVGISLAIGLSFVVSALIPAFASMSLNWVVFTEFISQVIFPFTLLFYIILGTLLIVSLFIIIKSVIIFNSKLEEREKNVKEKLQRWAIIGLLGVALLITVITLIVLGYYSNTNLKNEYNFTLEQTQDRMIVFLLITFLVLLIAALASIGISKLLGELRWFYSKIAKKNAFFIANSFKKSKHSLSAILIIVIIITSVNIFSMNLYVTNSRNIAEESYYNNGSDLRIQTSFVGYEYGDSIAEIEGIEEVLPILATEGILTYNNKYATIYGIDATKYSRIGRWISDSTNGSYEEMLNNLNDTFLGAIVSDGVAKKLSLTTDPFIYIDDMPNRSNLVKFNVSGIIHSAPGLGLSFGVNVEINQQNEEFVLINQRTMITKFAVIDTNLFFAKLKPGYEVDDVKSKILELSEVISVNPEVINEKFVGQYINIYIPDVNSFLISQIILVNLIGLIIIATNLEFILAHRKQNNAILKSIGNSNKNLIRIILSELLIVNIASIIAGLIIGAPLAALAIFLSRPIFTNHNILPFVFTFDYIRIPIFTIALILISSLTIIPSVLRFSRQNISIAIREE